MKIFFNLILLLTVTITCAQTPKTLFTIESPNSAQLKGAIESQVTFNTGKLGVSIPIYTIKEKDIEVPIVLSHNTTGVKVDQHPGWVGLNWGLEAGGTITRNVKGVPDESYLREDHLLNLAGDNTSSYVLPYGYFYNLSGNDNANWNSTQRITDLAKAGMEPGTFWSEAEPDEFVFNAGGYSGKFYMNEKGEFKVQGHPEIKVEATIIWDIPMFDPRAPFDIDNPFSYTNFANYGTVDGVQVTGYVRGYRAAIMAFRVYTPDGMIYDFGKADADPLFGELRELELSAPLFDQYAYNEVYTAWHLSKITAPSGETVTFEYELGGPTLQLGRSFSFYQAGGNAPASGFLGWLFGGPSASFTNAQEQLNGNFIRATYLKKITSRSTVVEFEISPTIELKFNYDAIAVEILERSRNYSKNYRSWMHGRMMVGEVAPSPYPPGITPLGNGKYIIDRYDNRAEYLDLGYMDWQKLDVIKVKSRVDNKLINEWEFTYNNLSNERLRLLSLKENGNQNSPLPPYLFNYEETVYMPPYNNMSADHWGYNLNWSPLININVESTLVDYKDDRNPDGYNVKAYNLKEVVFPTGGSKKFSYSTNRYTKLVKRDKYTGAFSIVNLPSNLFGPGLRIDQVTEVPADGTPEIVTQYTYGDGLLLGDIQYYWPDYKGRLLNGNEYTSRRFVTESLLPVSENTGGGLVVYDQVTETKPGSGKTVYNYRSFTESPDVQGISIDAEKSPYSPFSSGAIERGQLKEVNYYDGSNNLVGKDIYEYQANPAFSADRIRAVSSRGTIMFDGDQVNVIEGTAYTHLLHPYQNIKVTRSVKDEISGNFLTTEQRFVYNTSPMPDNDNQLKAEIKVNSKGENIRTEFKHPMDFKQTQPYTDMVARKMLIPVIEETTLKEPGTFLESLKINYQFWDNNWSATSKTLILPQNVERKVKDNPAEIVEKFHRYDDIGNLLTKSKEGNYKVSYIYGYNKLLPIAEIINADAKNVYYTSFEENENNVPRGEGFTGTKSSYGVYNKVISGLDNGKYVLSYWSRTMVDREWKYKQTDVDVTNGTFTILIEDAEVDELRLRPPGAIMTTYCYDPLVGMVNKCDENNKITYYEFDGHGRLVAILDHKKKFLKTFCYKYNGETTPCQTFVNSKYEGPAFKYCDDWYYSDILTYTVPAGKFHSFISQEDADRKAFEYYQRESRFYGESMAACHLFPFGSSAIADEFYPECTPPDEGLPIWIELPAGATRSRESQAHADALAMQEAQRLANEQGRCAVMCQLETENYNSGMDGYINFSNTATGEWYSFYVPADTRASIGFIPEGTYDVFIDFFSPPTGFNICSMSYSGASRSNVEFKKSNCNPALIQIFSF